MFHCQVLCRTCRTLNLHVLSRSSITGVEAVPSANGTATYPKPLDIRIAEQKFYKCLDVHVDGAGWSCCQANNPLARLEGTQRMMRTRQWSVIVRHVGRVLAAPLTSRHGSRPTAICPVSRVPSRSSSMNERSQEVGPGYATRIMMLLPGLTRSGTGPISRLSGRHGP
jgi:hypothetical protein